MVGGLARVGTAFLGLVCAIPSVQRRLQVKELRKIVGMKGGEMALIGRPAVLLRDCYLLPVPLSCVHYPYKVLVAHGPAHCTMLVAPLPWFGYSL